MKCGNCGLANLDHVAKCVKCGHALSAFSPPPGAGRLPTYPPRANKTSKLIRNIFYKFRRKTGRIPDANTYIPAEAANKPPFFRELYDISWPVLMGVIPGLGHWKQDRRLIAKVIFSLYILCLLFGVFFYGRFVSNLFFGLMISAHAASIFGNFRFGRKAGFRAMSVLMSAIFVLILTGYYHAYQGIISRVYGLWLTNNYGEPLMQAGDFVLVRVKPSYSRGEIVLFRKEYQEIRHGWVVAAGQFYDRVIGCPGDRIVLKNRIFTVNGFPLPENMYPLNRSHIFPDMEVTLGGNQYLIVPSAFRGGNNIPVEFLTNYCKVNISSIDGSMFMIYAPLTRMKILNQ